MILEREKCNCTKSYPIVLQFNFLDNPIVCSHCNLERAIDIDEKLQVEIFAWNLEYEELYLKWLNSDKIESDLMKKNSEINIRGLDIVNELSKKIKTYYWWYVSINSKIENCPNCNRKLKSIDNGYSQYHKLCDVCGILIND